jgi:hypothetical protein
VSVRKQEDVPLLTALLFEISEPLSFDWIHQGTGWYKDKKFISWAVPFGIFTEGEIFYIFGDQIMLPERELRGYLL